MFLSFYRRDITFRYNLPRVEELKDVLLRDMSAKTSRAGIWGVGRSTRDQFFRILIQK
jgi:hypothetical protein